MQLGVTPWWGTVLVPVSYGGVVGDSSVRVWRPSWPCPVREVLVQQRRGAGDPTLREDGRALWRGTRTPEGAATLRVETHPSDGEVLLEAWGPGRHWVLDRAPALLGAEDDLSGFDPRTPLVAHAWRQQAHWRLGRSGLVLESLVPSVIEQKVTGQEAFAAFRRLVWHHGEPAPGPGRDLGLWLPPTPEEVSSVPSWEWLALGVDSLRSSTVVRAARVASSLQRVVERQPERLDVALTSIPGVGRWTSAEVRQRVLGDADAVAVGDYHLATQVGWALGYQRFTDADLEDYLEPWRPHRGRVAHLLREIGSARPRRGPRMAPRTHLPVRRR